MRKTRHFYTKVVGVTRRNADGSSRQDVIRYCRPFEKVVLRVESDNPVDPNAVAVLRARGGQLGYLRAEIAAAFVRYEKEGDRCAAFITQVTGGTAKKPTLGVNLVVIIAEGTATDSDAQAYVDRVVTPELKDDLGLTEKAKQSGCLVGILSCLSIGIAAGCAFASWF